MVLERKQRCIRCQDHELELIPQSPFRISICAEEGSYVTNYINPLSNLGETTVKLDETRIIGLRITNPTGFFKIVEL